ncbi:unnamed protein product [Choristocarpus tenellus]
MGRPNAGIRGLFRWKKDAHHAQVGSNVGKSDKTPNLTPVSPPAVVVQPPTSARLTHKFVGEKSVYKGWRGIVRRRVKGPTGKVILYDVITQEHPSVLVFIWDTQVSKNVALSSISY